MEGSFGEPLAAASPAPQQTISPPRVGAPPLLLKPEDYLVSLAAARGRPPVPRRFLVDQLVPARGPALMVGRSGIGKTPLLFQLGLCVATGSPFLGLPTTKGKVLYIDAETSEEACYEYFRSLSTFLGVPQGQVPDFWVHSVNWSPWPQPGASPQERTRRLVELLRPDLVIFDCLRPLWPQAEKGSEEAQAFWGYQRSLINTFGCATLTVHHCRKPPQDPKTGRSLGVRVQDDAREWLNNAAGSGALITQAESRLAVDFWKQRDESALVIGGFTKAQEQLTPLIFERQYDEDGGAIGYRKNERALWDSLSEDDKQVFQAIPERFRCRDVIAQFPDKSRSTVQRTLDRLKHTGRLIQGPDKSYTKL